MKNRIRSLRKANNLTQVEFGEKIGVKGNTVTNYENGMRNPTDAVILSICREFNVNENWLRYGTEPKERNRDDKLSEYIVRIAKGDDDFIRDLVEVYYELDSTSREALKVIVRSMTDKMNKRG